MLARLGIAASFLALALCGHAASAQSLYDADAARYAHAVRRAAELSVSYGPNHPSIIAVCAERNTLLDGLSRSGAADIHVVLASALHAQLIDVKADRALLVTRYGVLHPAIMRADAEIEALEAALAVQRRS